MAAETKRSKLGALCTVEAGLHMHQRAQARRASMTDPAPPGEGGTKMSLGEGGSKNSPGENGAKKSPGGGRARRPRCGPAYLPCQDAEGRCRKLLRVYGRGARRWLAMVTRLPWVRRVGFVTAGTLAVVLLIGGGLYWRLSSGPISLDMITPWLAKAIAENIGNQFQIEVGGTVLERDEHGRAAIRIRDIKVRDRDGALIASAPKAEVGLSSASLFSGTPRAERLNLVGAELAIRVEADGRVSVSTGTARRPLATTVSLASVGPSVPASPARPLSQGGDKRTLQENLATFLAWLDSLGALGLDGGDLTEIGLKSGNLVVDDVRTGHQSKFENIRLSLTRPHSGELEFALGSEDASRPWLVQANITPIGNGVRAVSFDARSLSLRDLLLALRVDCSNFEADGSISATLRGEVAPDGTPEIASGRFMMVNGTLNDPSSPDTHIPIDRAEMTIDWSNAQHALAVPFQLVSGGTRFTLMARAEAPRDPNGAWVLGLSGGSVVLTPADPGDEAVLLNRIVVRGRLDPVAQRLKIEQGEASGKGVGFAMSGMLDFSTPDPRLAIGLASRNMTFAAFKQLWPPFINPPVRQWVMERVSGGVIEQAEIATNAPMSTLRNGGPPVPDDGLSIQIVTSGSTVRPFDDLPEIREADLVTRIKGRSATVSLGRGTVEMPSGRRLTMANGVFEVPETLGEHPPARVRTRIEGPVAAGVDLLNMDRLKGTVGVQLDPATTRGNILATFNMGLPLGEEIKDGTITYSVTADIANFAADRFLMSQKVEAQTLRAFANNQGYQIRGDMRIGGVPAIAEMRRNAGESDAEVKLQATLDDAARTRLGWDTTGNLGGPVTFKVAGRVDLGGDQENKLAVEADFAQAKIENLLPGWVKPANRPARGTFTYVGGKGRPGRFDDIVIDGGGATIRGNAETDANGDLMVANFPVFGMTDGDKATLRVERTPDNLYKATVRGDVYDGRGFIKSSMAGSGNDAKQKRPGIDVDLDAKVDKFVGLKGESLRNVDMHMTKRGGTLRALSLNAKIGNDGTLTGEMRGRPGERQVVVIESSDAGALFRFTDTYSRMIGGQAWIAMDPPNSEGNPQEGLLNVTDFSVKGEAALDRIAAGPPNVVNNGVQFSRMRAGFTRAPGRMTIREGLVSGPMIGASIDGLMDYANNELHLRGTFVPLHELNSAFGEIPIVGFFLGGKEGLIGSMTYEVVGSPGAPVLRVNPISMVAPGFVRKFLEFPSNLPGDRFPEPWQNSRN
jgi:AsmA-like C-terminal region/Protein of unknown function